MNKDIFIILPYKESLNSTKAGAVSIYVQDALKYSKYKKQIQVISSDDFSDSRLFRNKTYINNFCKKYKNNKISIIEIHNRPEYANILKKKFPNSKIILTYHNDPQTLRGSINTDERKNLLEICTEIVFISNWIKKRFFKNINDIKNNSKIIYHGITKKEKILQKNKKKQILFVGKLNENKGYDIFVEAATKFKKLNPEWKFIAIGNESRKKIFPDQNIVSEIGYKSNKEVLKYYENSEIAIGNSKWDEPLGRIAIEASSRKCCPLITNVGGLIESKHISIVLKENNSKNIIKILNKLTKNKKHLRKLQNNFYDKNNFDIKKISNLIDNIRDKILNVNSSFSKIGLKILHITNLNERYNGRLFYNTGRRLNNGFVKLNHKVLTLSDRDLLRNYKSLTDISGSKKLNKTFIETVRNFKPNLIVLGHADSIKKESLIKIKNKFPEIKIVQWFLDRMDNQWKINKSRFLDKIEFMDYSFCTTDPKSLKFNKKYNISFIPNPVDQSLDDMKVFENDNPEFDLFFAMSHGVHRGVLKKGKFDKRELFINNLISKNPNLKFNIFGMNKIQPVWGDEFKTNLFNSKIALNLSQGKPLKYYSSDRIAQLMGNGIATLIDKKTKLNHLFSSKSAIFYNSFEDLNLKLNKLVKNDQLRNKIALRGKIEYHKKYNSIKVADFIICKVFNIKKKFSWK